VLVPLGERALSPFRPSWGGAISLYCTPCKALLLPDVSSLSCLQRLKYNIGRTIAACESAFIYQVAGTWASVNRPRLLCLISRHSHTFNSYTLAQREACVFRPDSRFPNQVLGHTAYPLLLSRLRRLGIGVSVKLSQFVLLMGY